MDSRVPLAPHSRASEMKRTIIALATVPVLVVGLSAVVAMPARATDNGDAAATVTVDPAATHQTIDGFGGSGAFNVASVLHGSTGLSAAKQHELLDVLFSTRTGAGLSILRNEVGAASTPCSTGASGDDACSIEPTDPGGPNSKPTYVWDGSDADQVWLTRQAKARGLGAVIADAWSAPAYMKTNNSLIGGGNLCGVPGAVSCASGDWRQPYANYLVKYLQFYKDAGIKIDYLSYANEPDLSPGYAGMNWDAADGTSGPGVVDPATPQNIDFINNYLGPTLAKSRLGTKIACCEATSWPAATTYANGLMSNATTRDYLGIVTGHGYYSAPSGALGPNPITSANKAGKHTWETEVSNFEPYNGSWASADISTSGYQWALNIHQALVDADVSAYLHWALTWNGGLTGANNGTLTLVDGANDTFYVPKRVWAFAGYSRYVRPGAVRIDANSTNAALKSSAFRNKDGSYVIVVINTADAAVAANYVSPGRTVVPYLTNETNSMAQQPGSKIKHGQFTATIPAKSMMTFNITK